MMPLRCVILKTFRRQQAICKDIRKRRKLPIIVVGGGPPVLKYLHVCRMKEYSLKEYPELATSASNIYLIDGDFIS
jgi:NADH dehydrogenase